MGTFVSHAVDLISIEIEGMSKYEKRISAMNTYKQIKKGKTMDILDLICEDADIDKGEVIKTLVDKIPEGMTAFNYAAPGLTVTFFRKILIDDFGVDDNVISNAFEQMSGGNFGNIISGVFNHDSGYSGD